MKRFICIFWLLRAIALATAGVAFLGVWMPGAGAYVSEDWRSNSVMSVMDFQQIDAELGSQKTLVPGVENKWIICRNDPVNKTDPDGNSPLNWLLRKIGVPALKGGLTGAMVDEVISNSGGYEVSPPRKTKNRNFHKAPVLLICPAGFESSADVLTKMTASDHE